MLTNQMIIEKLLKLAKIAFNKGEVPVAALVIQNNEVILSKKYNKREKKRDVTGHAEILAIRQASKKLKRWNLSDCDLYVTLKPCSMCLEVIKQSRIKNVYYLLEKPDYKHEYSKTNIQKFDFENASECYQQLLSEFFRNIR